MIRWTIERCHLVDMGVRKITLNKSQMKHLRMYWTDVIYMKEWRKKQDRHKSSWERYLEERLENGD